MKQKEKAVYESKMTKKEVENGKCTIRLSYIRAGTFGLKCVLTKIRASKRSTVRIVKRRK